jgi:transposase-like protein
MADMNMTGMDETPVCPKCGWSAFRKCGRRFRAGQKVQQLQCKHCGRLMRGSPISSSDFPPYTSL